jgi:uncharacterized protein
VVEREIIPFIQNRYAVDSNERILVGRSLGGLAAVHALLTRPDLFRRYVILSPSIWWDDWFSQRGDRYVMRMEEKTREFEYPDETRVYFAVGDTEEQFGLVTDLHVLANALRNRRDDNLKVYLEVLGEELHEGIFPDGFMRGIVGIYSGDADRRPSASKVRW